MKNVHNVTRTLLLPMVCKKQDLDIDDFVMRPKQSKRFSSESFTSSVRSHTEETSLDDNKTIFSPQEVNLLPRPPVYTMAVGCSLCDFKTKVKSNMVRHLQAHMNEQAVPVIAPVNPVPCLEKKEKMFDKMINLASSSHLGGRIGGLKTDPTCKEESNIIPGFIPAVKRYVKLFKEQFFTQFIIS